MLGELRYTSRSFYKVEVKILGGGYFNPSLCNLLPLAKVGKFQIGQGPGAIQVQFTYHGSTAVILRALFAVLVTYISVNS